MTSNTSKRVTRLLAALLAITVILGVTPAEANAAPDPPPDLMIEQAKVERLVNMTAAALAPTPEVGAAVQSSLVYFSASYFAWQYDPYSKVSCYRNNFKRKRDNPDGYTTRYPAVKVEWCVTEVDWFGYWVSSAKVYSCGNIDGFFMYEGCNMDRGDTGYKSLHASTHWDYQYLIPKFDTFARDVEIEIIVGLKGSMWWEWHW